MTLRTGALAVAVAILASGLLLPAVLAHTLAHAAGGEPAAVWRWIVAAGAPLAVVAGGSLAGGRGQGWLLGGAAGGLVAMLVVGPAAGVTGAGAWLAHARVGGLSDDVFRVALAHAMLAVVERTQVAVWACLLVGALLGGLGAWGQEAGRPQPGTASEAVAAIGVTVTAAIGAAGTYFALEVVGGTVREILGPTGLRMTWWPLGTSLMGLMLGLGWTWRVARRLGAAGSPRLGRGALVIAGLVPVLLLIVFAAGGGPWWFVPLPIAGAGAIALVPHGTPTADDDVILRGIGDALAGSLGMLVTLGASLGVSGLVLALAVVPAIDPVRGATPAWTVTECQAVAQQVLAWSALSWIGLGLAAFLPGASWNAALAWLRARREGGVTG